MIREFKVGQYVLHRNQADWGLGKVTEVNDRLIRIFFRHSGLMAIGRQFSALITVEPSPSPGIVAELEEGLSRLNTEKPKARKATPIEGPKVLPVVTFEKQLALFRATFPLGFNDPRFIAEERGDPTARGKKAYKAAAIQLAGLLLSKESLEALLSVPGCRGAYSVAKKLINATRNLVFEKELICFQNMAQDKRHEEIFARALYRLLHASEPLADRFDGFVGALLQGSATWTIATIFPALYAPSEHTFVKPTFIKRQAEILQISINYRAAPTGAVYERLLAVALQVEKQLSAEGLQPRDLMDVHSFIWRTLSMDSPIGPE